MNLHFQFHYCYFVRSEVSLLLYKMAETTGYDPANLTAWQAGVLPIELRFLIKMVAIEGLEPPTHWLWFNCSNHLSYIAILKNGRIYNKWAAFETNSSFLIKPLSNSQWQFLHIATRFFISLTTHNFVSNGNEQIGCMWQIS